MRTHISRGVWLVSACSLAGLATAAALLAAGVVTSPARAASPASKLFAYVVPTSRGPLQACSPDGTDCTARNNGVRYFIYVVNGNALANPEQGVGGFTRASFPNSFVVSSVEQLTSVNGITMPTLGVFYTPPPDTDNRNPSGRWPATVTCPVSGPCNIVGSPAVVPGEAASVFFANWFHASNEPNGTYVFRFIVRGTLNGAPVNLTASTPPILMTS